jgi:very-short-patch-repair endonuclease
MLTYNKDLKEKSNNLRNESTLSEVLLWKRLKSKQLDGFRFLRQKPIGKYIVDFYCHKLKLVIEIDGASHYENSGYDNVRDKYLENLGLSVLRISDARVKKKIEGVIYEIEEWIEKLK